MKINKEVNFTIKSIHLYPKGNNCSIWYTIPEIYGKHEQSINLTDTEQIEIKDLENLLTQKLTELIEKRWS